MACLQLICRVCSVCLTDQASCGCCLMQQQIDRMKMFFNMSLGELEKELTKAKNVLNNVRGEIHCLKVKWKTSRLHCCLHSKPTDTQGVASY